MNYEENISQKKPFLVGSLNLKIKQLHAGPYAVIPPHGLHEQRALPTNHLIYPGQLISSTHRLLPIDEAQTQILIERH